MFQLHCILITSTVFCIFNFSPSSGYPVICYCSFKLQFPEGCTSCTGIACAKSVTAHSLCCVYPPQLYKHLGRSFFSVSCWPFFLRRDLDSEGWPDTIIALYIFFNWFWASNDIHLLLPLPLKILLALSSLLWSSQWSFSSVIQTVIPEGD